MNFTVIISIHTLKKISTLVSKCLRHMPTPPKKHVFRTPFGHLKPAGCALVNNYDFKMYLNSNAKIKKIKYKY